MSEASPLTPNPKPVRKPRAWWQWLIGGGLLAFALVSGALRLVSHYQPELFIKDLYVPPVPLAVLPDLKPADALATAPGSLKGANLVIVTMDTTRADRLACYGNPDIKTPTLDGLARKGVLFSKAISVAPTTLPSHASIMTGLYPFHHGARSNSLFRLPEGQTTVAEVLSGQGYDTAAFVSAFVLDSRFGVGQGFDIYQDDLTAEAGGMRSKFGMDPERRADATTDRAITWMNDRTDKPYFMWVHYFDPHQPYEPPGAYADQYVDVPYDGEIAFVDEQLKRLLDAIDTRKQTDNTIVIVIGDHGQGLQQHGELTHGLLLYDTTLNVPMIMACGSKLGGGLHVSRVVSSIDVAPTVLSLLGAPPLPKIDGVDLATNIPASRPIFSDTLEGFVQHIISPLVAVRDGDLKYIHGPDPELFDIKQDVNEEKNLISSRADAVESLKQKITQFYDGDLEKGMMARPTEQLSQEELNQLKALGYAGEGAGMSGFKGPLPDPKKMLPVIRRAELARTKMVNEGANAAIKDFEDILAENPDSVLAYRWLADCYIEKKELEKARETLEKGLKVHTDDPQAHLLLGRIAEIFDQPEDAKQHYMAAIEISPDHFSALAGLAGLLLQLGENDGAARYAKKACIVRPTDEIAAEVMAIAHQRANRPDEAIEFLRARLKQDPKLFVARSALSQLLLLQNKCDEAYELMKEGVRLHPENLKLANNFACVLLTCQTTAAGVVPLESAVLMEKVCRKSEFRVPEYMRTLCYTYVKLRRMDEAIALAEKAEQIASAGGNTWLASALKEDLVKFREAKAQGITPMTPMQQPPTATQPASHQLDIMRP